MKSTILPLQENVRLDVRFKKVLPEHATCILYAEFPRHIEIDSSRNVRVEYLQIDNILTKHVKYFQGVYPVDFACLLSPQKPGTTDVICKHVPSSVQKAPCVPSRQKKAAAILQVTAIKRGKIISISNGSVRS